MDPCANRFLRRAIGSVIVFVAGCGGGGNASPPRALQTFTIHVHISGFVAGGLVLRNNGADPLIIANNGVADFPARLPDGAGYAVTADTELLTGPPQLCTLMPAGGVVAGADVTV